MFGFSRHTTGRRINMAKIKKKTTPQNPTKNRLKHPAIFEEFVKWIALPDPFKQPQTQGEFAEKYKIGRETLSDWKQREGFWEAVKEERIKWGKERTPNVIAGLYRKAVRDGNASEAKLWLQYIEGWAEEQKIDIHGKEIGEIAEALKKIAKIK